jgi:hypothetical protein
VTFGGLSGEISYGDDAFGIDPDIQQMFYGSEPGQPDETDEPGRSGDAAS